MHILPQKCNQICYKKTHNFEKIETLPGRFFSVLKRIFPKKKTGTRKQRRLLRFSYEKKSRRLAAGVKAYIRRAKIKKFIWAQKYGASSTFRKSLLVPSWTKKVRQKNKQKKQLVNMLKIENHSPAMQLLPFWKTLSDGAALTKIGALQKNRLLQKKSALWKQTASTNSLTKNRLFWALFSVKRRKQPISPTSSAQLAAQQKPSALNTRVWAWHKKVLFARERRLKKPQNLRVGRWFTPKASNLRRLGYEKLGKRWKRKLRFWKYRRSRWKRFEHYRRLSIYRWNNLGKWASFQLYPYKIYRRVHQPFRFRKAKRLKKNRWFRLLNRGYKKGLAIDRRVRLQNQQQYLKLYSFFYGFSRPKQIMERSRHFLHLKGSGPQKRNIWLSWLERRLDVVLCRIRLAPSIAVARILITRGYIWINKKQEMNPQKRVQLWDVVEINKNDLSFPRFWYFRNRYQKHAYKSRKLRYRFFHAQKTALPFGFMIKNPLAADIPKNDLTSVTEVERLFLYR